MNRPGYHAAYYQANKERLKAKAAARRAANPEKVRAEIRKCWLDPEKRAKYLARRSEWYVDYAPVAQERTKKWQKEHGDGRRSNARSAGYRAAKLRRKPCWLSRDDLWMIKEAYELAALRSKATGIKWHVDHIIPLRGKTVSGLHVPTNLQVITARENHRKLNRFA